MLHHKCVGEGAVVGTTTPPVSPPPGQECLQVQHGSSCSAHNGVHGVRVPENRPEHHPTTVQAQVFQMECDKLFRKLGESEAEVAALKRATDEAERAQCEAAAEKHEAEHAPCEAEAEKEARVQTDASSAEEMIRLKMELRDNPAKALR